MHLINKYKEAGTGNPARDERHNLPDSMFSKEQKNIFKTSWVFFRKNNLRFSEEAGVPMWVEVWNQNRPYSWCEKAEASHDGLRNYMEKKKKGFCWSENTKLRSSGYTDVNIYLFVHKS